MNALESTSTRPYLIRALYDWCVDNTLTPYIAVLADDTVQVPHEYIEFKARFAGQAREIMVPINRVLAIYARENGQGMAFPVSVEALASEEPAAAKPSALSSVPAAGADAEGGPVQLVSSEAPDHDPGDEPPRPPAPAAGGPRPALKRVK